MGYVNDMLTIKYPDGTETYRDRNSWWPVIGDVYSDLKGEWVVYRATDMGAGNCEVVLAVLEDE